MRGFSLDQLQTFMDVVEAGGFSAAATRLGMSQPAVSQQVRELERRLGARLVDRVGRRATATPAGETLLRHARVIRAAVEEATSSLSPYASGAAGRVRLGTGATALTYLLPEPLRALKSRFPDLEIAVKLGTSDQIVKDVADNALDLGFVTLPASGRMFDVTPVREDPFVLIGPPGGRPDPGPATPPDVARLPLIVHGQDDHTRGLVTAWFAAAGERPRIEMELGGVEAMKRLVAAGLGWAIVPRVALVDESGPVIVRDLAPPLSRTLAIVVRRDKTLSRGMREAIAALEALGGASPDEPAGRSLSRGRPYPSAPRTA